MNKQISKGTPIGENKVRLENGLTRIWGGPAGGLHQQTFFRYDEDGMYCYPATETDYEEKQRQDELSRRLYVINRLTTINNSNIELATAIQKWFPEKVPTAVPHIQALMQAYSELYQLLKATDDDNKRLGITA